jgi:hypothetical protein
MCVPCTFLARNGGYNSASCPNSRNVHPIATISTLYPDYNGASCRYSSIEISGDEILPHMRRFYQTYQIQQTVSVTLSLAVGRCRFGACEMVGR